MAISIAPYRMRGGHAALDRSGRNRRRDFVTLHSQDTALKHWRDRIDAELSRLIPPDTAVPVRLHQSMRHSLLAPGKRVRPLLAILAADHWGGPAETALAPACALEMVHAASLILDDLPAMDDSALRRGRPANHRIYGEGTAILAAIGLMNRAFGVAADAPDLDARARSAAVAILSRAIGSEGLVAGQEQDLHDAAELTSPQAVEAMHGRKTGALFAAAGEIGAVVAGCGAAECRDAHEFGYKLGVAFQTFDDLVDRHASQDAALKDVGKDAGKPTLISLAGSHRALERAQQLLAEALSHATAARQGSALEVFVRDLSAGFLDRLPEMDRYGVA